MGRHSDQWIADIVHHVDKPPTMPRDEYLESLGYLRDYLDMRLEEGKALSQATDLAKAKLDAVLAAQEQTMRALALSAQAKLEAALAAEQEAAFVAAQVAKLEDDAFGGQAEVKIDMSEFKQVDDNAPDPDTSDEE